MKNLLNVLCPTLKEEPAEKAGGASFKRRPELLGCPQNCLETEIP